MTHSPYRILLTALTLLLFASGCRKEADPRPMADLNLLKGRWSRTGNAGPDDYVMEFNPTTRVGTLIQVPIPNRNGFRVGDKALINVEPVDERTWQGELLYRGPSDFNYADVRLNLENNDLIYYSDSGVTTGNLTVSDQTGKYRRVR